MKQRTSISRNLKLIAWILAGVILVRIFVFEVCIVSTESMVPAIRPTEIIVIDKLTYGCNLPRRWADIPLLNVFTWIPYLRLQDERTDWGFCRGWGLRTPQEGDVAVFLAPNRPYTMLVKRIHTVIDKGTSFPIDSMRTTIEPMALSEHVPIIRRLNKTYVDGRPTTHYTTKSTFYDMRGDNAGNSYDSRQFGPINEEALIGRMGLILWSWDDKETGWKKIRWNRLFRTVR